MPLVAGTRTPPEAQVNCSVLWRLSEDADAKPEKPVVLRRVQNEESESLTLTPKLVSRLPLVETLPVMLPA